MGRFLDRLDAAWDLYARITGALPEPFKALDGKATVAAIPALPDGSLTCGYGCGFLGRTGVEVTGFDDRDYDLVAGQPDAFPHYYFYEMGATSTPSATGTRRSRPASPCSCGT